MCTRLLVLGAGVPVFAPRVSKDLSLIGGRQLPGSQIVALRYAVAATSPAASPNL